MKKSTITITFTLNNGHTYTQQSNGYCFMTDENGKKVRCSTAAYNMAEKQYNEERQQKWHEIMDDLDTAAEDDNVTPDVYTEAEQIVKTVKKSRKPRRSKDVAYEGNGLTLTAKQVDFICHLSDTYFWENGLDSIIWVDCLCDDIGGQFQNKPMTVGAMISTLCEKGLGTRATDLRDNRKCVSFALTDLGKQVAKELGLF